MCFHAGRTGRARQQLTRALLAGGGDAPWAVQQLVQTYVQRGEADKARRLLGGLRGVAAGVRALGLGYLLRLSGREAEAAGWLERAAATGPAAAAACLDLAILRPAGRRSNAALAWLRRGERALRSQRDRWGMAVALHHRARLAEERADFPRAIESAAKAAALRRKCGDRLGLGHSLRLEAKARYRLGDYAGAVACLQQALETHERAGHGLGLALALNNLGLWHLDLANPKAAAERFRAARRWFRRIGDRAREAVVLANLGNACRQLGDWSRGARSYRRCLGLLPRSASADARGIAVAELAEVECRRGRPAAAAALLGRERRRLRGASVATHGLLYAEQARARLDRGDVAGALRSARRARRLVSVLGPGELGRTGCEIKAGLVEARALLAAGRGANAARALGALERELDGLVRRQGSAQARMGLVDAHRETHDLWLRALLEPDGGARRAFAAAARFKGRELGRGAGRPGRGARRRSLEAEISGLAAAPRLSRDEEQRLGELRRRHAEGVGELLRERMPSRSRATERATFAPVLDADTALLEYHVGRDTTHVFVVCQGRVRAVDLGLGEAGLAAAISRLLAPLRAAGSSADPRAELVGYDLDRSCRLFDQLLAPALERLENPAARLVIVPDGPLHALPFELLARRRAVGRVQASPPPAAHGAVRYVLEEHIVSYARSSRLLQPPSRRGPPQSFLGLAFSPPRPVVLWSADGPLTLGALAGAAREVRALAPLFARPLRLEGSEATAAGYRREAPCRDVVHIAAHAWAEPLAPGLSGVVLAAADRGSPYGCLSAEAIREVRLRAALVTLSACDGGFGALRAREGALDLARSFLEAGAESVLAALWPVDDRATSELMLAFYAHLREGSERARALALAKRELRSDCGRHLLPPRAHPYFWAPFVLVDHRPGVARA